MISCVDQGEPGLGLRGDNGSPGQKGDKGDRGHLGLPVSILSKHALLMTVYIRDRSNVIVYIRVMFSSCGRFGL